ncbi:MAG: hypothetical protein KGL74_09040 [Elusimicrobia bacterium]|nr:hypothetical protein [Elusimicrobiota bacterium]MDE2511254.1 hypothetical protein [Elusimicrobiota bacterium]
MAEAIPLLEKLPPQPAGSEDSELGRWSKKGVRIPYKDLPTALEYLRQMKALVAAP